MNSIKNSFTDLPHHFNTYIQNDEPTMIINKPTGFLYKHNDNLYMIVRRLKEHQVTGKDGQINMEFLKAWRDWEQADHVLKDGDTFLLCQTVEEAKIVE